MKRILEWNLTRMQVRISQMIRNIKKRKQRMMSPSSMLDCMAERAKYLLIGHHYGYILAAEDLKAFDVEPNWFYDAIMVKYQTEICEYKIH